MTGAKAQLADFKKMIVGEQKQALTVYKDLAKDLEMHKTVHDVLEKFNLPGEKLVLEEKFGELMDPKSGLLNERERTLFLNMCYRLNLVEPYYTAAFVGQFYEVAKQKEEKKEEVLQQIFNMTGSAWGVEVKESFQDTFQHAKLAGVPYSTNEKIMLTSLANYSFMETLRIRVPIGHSFLAQLTETAALSSLKSQQENDSATTAKKLLYNHLMYPSGLALNNMDKISAITFSEWTSDRIDPEFKKMFGNLVFKSSKTGLLNNPFSAMEYISSLGIIGGAYFTQPLPPKENFSKILDKVSGSVHGFIWGAAMKAQIWRLVLIGTQTALLNPTTSALKWLDSIISDVSKAIDKGKIKNAKELKGVADALYFIAQFGGYDLAKVTDAILDEVGKKGRSLDDVLSEAKWLAFNGLNITGGLLGTLRKVSDWKKKWGDKKFRTNIMKKYRLKWGPTVTLTTVPKKLT